MPRRKENKQCVKSNEIALPVVGCEGNEDFLVITFKIPTGADKGMTPYDGYAIADDYEMSCKVKADKARESAKRKAAKIARDAEIRKRKTKIFTRYEDEAPWPEESVEIENARAISISNL